METKLQNRGFLGNLKADLPGLPGTAHRNVMNARCYSVAGAADFEFGQPVTPKLDHAFPVSWAEKWEKHVPWCAFEIAVGMALIAAFLSGLSD